MTANAVRALTISPVLQAWGEILDFAARGKLLEELRLEKPFGALEPTRAPDDEAEGAHAEPVLERLGSEARQDLEAVIGGAHGTNTDAGRQPKQLGLEVFEVRSEDVAEPGMQGPV